MTIPKSNYVKYKTKKGRGVDDLQDNLLTAVPVWLF